MSITYYSIVQKFFAASTKVISAARYVDAPAKRDQITSIQQRNKRVETLRRARDELQQVMLKCEVELRELDQSGPRMDQLY